jgi:hypothetical protein
MKELIMQASTSRPEAHIELWEYTEREDGEVMGFTVNLDCLGRGHIISNFEAYEIDKAKARFIDYLNGKDVL